MKYAYLFLLFLFSCSGLEKSEYQKIRKKNQIEDRVDRHHDSSSYALVSPKHRFREAYPWEEAAQNLPKITKDFFRCRGTRSNPDHFSEAQKVCSDCEDGKAHSLPLKEDKEFIYPLLVDLLNYIQKKTQKRVVITCGHRCPLHNEYSESSKEARISKHMIGAEVDFYVQGMEDKPLDVVDLIFAYYMEGKEYKGKSAYTIFYRYEKEDTNVSIKPWYNKELFIKLYQNFEGRDFDNRHSFPYIGIQVRFDRKSNQRVTYTWEQAHQGYRR